MEWKDLSWILVLISLAGNFFVIKKNVLGQWLWTFGNTGWVAYNLYIGSYSQAFLFTIYLAMSIWAVYAWTKESSASTKSA